MNSQTRTDSSDTWVMLKTVDTPSTIHTVIIGNAGCLKTAADDRCVPTNLYV